MSRGGQIRMSLDNADGVINCAFSNDFAKFAEKLKSTQSKL